MANTYCGEPNSLLNAPGIGYASPSLSRMGDLPERPIGELDAVGTAQRLTELEDEARAHMNPESSPRFASLLAHQEPRVLARYRALRQQSESDPNREGTAVRTRPLDSQFGSDGNQYNPYAPHTSEEFMLQEIEAGRMDPETMDTPRHLPNTAQSPSPGSGARPPLAHVHTGGQVSWMAPGHRSDLRQGLYGPGLQVGLTEASWFQPSYYSDSTAAEDLGEEEYPDVYPAMYPYLDTRGSLAGSHSPYSTLADTVFNSHDSPFGVQGPLSSSLDPPSMDENLTVGVPRQPHVASAGRERKRLAKPSLVVKLKTDYSAQESSQSHSSLRRGRSDASSSSESSFAAQTTQNSHPFNLRPRGPAGTSSTNPRHRPGVDPQALRRLARRAEAIQSSHRKRRRDAVSPQDLSPEGATTASLPQGKFEHVLA